MNILCDIAKRSDKDVFDLNTLMEVEARLAAIFWANIPNKEPICILKELPADVQQRALDYVHYVDSQSDKITYAIQQCKEAQHIGLY